MTMDDQFNQPGEIDGTHSALIFIPDITGFTKFVSETEITHSQRIIARLLEVILGSNTIDLEVSEIEGDAVLFFKLGGAPPAADIGRQAETMYIQFHHQLRVMIREKDCECGACGSMNRLSLKFVAHYGEVRALNVRGFKKLLGSDVIVAHRLLKNTVEGKEYLLMSESFLLSQGIEDPGAMNGWVERMVEGSTEYEHLGTVRYRTLSLTPLLKQVPPT